MLPFSDRVMAEVEKARAKTNERIKWLLELERLPYTLNDHYYTECRYRYLAKYRAIRNVRFLCFG